MAKNLTIDLNGSLKVYGIKDKAILSLYSQSQNITFTTLKPIINSKKVSIKVDSGQLNVSYLTDIVNEEFYKLVELLNKFALDNSAKHCVTAVVFEYNTIIIIMNQLKLDVFFDDLFECLGISNSNSNRYATSDLTDNLKILRVSNCIEEIGFSRNLIFDIKHHRIHLNYNELFRSMTKMYYPDVMRPINVYLINYANGNDRHQLHFSPEADSAFDYNLKRLLRHLIDMKSIRECKGARCINDLRNSINVNEDRITVTLAPGVSMVDFVVELESLNDIDLYNKAIEIDCSEYYIDGPLRDTISYELMELDEVKSIQWDVNFKDHANTATIEWESNSERPLALRMYFTKIIERTVDKYYMDMIGDLFLQ